MEDAQSAKAAVRGTIADRPWGLTLAGLSAAGGTTRLSVRSDDKLYQITFDRGVVVDASSPLAVDAVIRIALTSHFINPGQVPEIKRCIAKAPALDELEVLGAAARLTRDQLRALRLRIIAQRAARTFAVERGEYDIEDCAPPAASDGGVDIGAVIYLGAHLNLSEERLALDLRQLGTRFVLRLEMVDELARFGFTDAERPIIDALLAGTTLPELEAIHREIDPRVAQAVLYTLASCDALILIESPPVAEVEDESTSGVPAALDVHSMVTARAEIPRSMIDSFRTGLMTTVRPNALAAHDVEVLIAQRTALLDRGVDHFTLLGIPIGATIEVVHAAYVELSRNLRPRRLAELGIPDDGFAAQRLLAQIGIAFTVLTDRVRRPEYIAALQSLRRQTRR